MVRATRIRATVLLASLALTGFAGAQPYRVTNLVSDGSVPARNTDRLLVNGFGLARSGGSTIWVSSTGAGRAVLFDGDGVVQTLVVEIPSVKGSTNLGHPTGIVFSGGPGFTITANGQTRPASFIFATAEGTISGWQPQVDATHAILAASGTTPGAFFTGLAIATGAEGRRLYAADFHNARVDVFNSTFTAMKVAGGFADPTIPPGFAPLNVQAIGDRIYVTYGLRNDDGEYVVRGPGLGFVNAFDVDGRRLARVASRGVLNAPWGVALAPADFGAHSNQLLIGNFGDGRLNAFAAMPVAAAPASHSFRFAGPVRDATGPVVIDGLWGITFGNDAHNQPHNALFFGAGPNEEIGGLFGRIDTVP